MKQVTTRITRRLAHQTLVALVLLGGLTAVACDNRVEFSPTAPKFPSFTSLGDRNLEISATLTSEQASCQDAMILYDGVELAGGRSVCEDVGGCTSMQLSAATSSSSGHHTIEFLVLRQASMAVEYTVQGRVYMTREGLSMMTTIPLGPTTFTLDPGDSAIFDLDFVD